MWNVLYPKLPRIFYVAPKLAIMWVVNDKWMAVSDRVKDGGGDGVSDDWVTECRSTSLSACLLSYVWIICLVYGLAIGKYCCTMGTSCWRTTPTTNTPLKNFHVPASSIQRYWIRSSRKLLLVKKNKTFINARPIKVKIPHWFYWQRKINIPF